jgi:RNA polymerase sigma factor (sigma-70 family)
MTDGELLCLYARERSDTAFRELVARHLDLVYSAALRQTQARSHLAEDVSQLVFAELARKAPLLTRHPSLRGWLFLCTRHIAAKVLRGEYRRTARETTAQAMNELTSQPAAEWEKVMPVLDDVLYNLKDEDREAIFLRFFDKCSFADLGDHLGVGEDAARRRVERVLERIRRLLARRGITSTAAALAAALTTETVTAAPKELAAGVAQAALSAASTAPTSLIFTLAMMKSIALSTTFIALVAVTSFMAGGAGLYFSRELSRDEASASAKAAAVAAAEASLSKVKQQLAHSVLVSHASPRAPITTASLEDQVARDLELSRWKSEQAVALGILYAASFLKQHGVTGEQMQQLVAAARKAYADLGDLQEVARLAGIQIQSDPDLLAQLQQIEAQYAAAVTAAIGSENLDALNAYVAGIGSLNQNPAQSGLARWVSEQVGGTAFAEGNPLTGDQKAQMAQLLLKYTPSYPAGQQGDYSTLDWNGIISEAQQTSVPDSELAALQSFHAAEETWELKKQAAQAAAGTNR